MTGMFIPDPDLDFFFYSGSRGQKGIGSRIRNIASDVWSAWERTNSLSSHCFSWLLSRGMKNRMKKGAALISSVAPIACKKIKLKKFNWVFTKGAGVYDSKNVGKRTFLEYRTVRYKRVWPKFPKLTIFLLFFNFLPLKVVSNEKIGGWECPQTLGASTCTCLGLCLCLLSTHRSSHWSLLWLDGLPKIILQDAVTANAANQYLKVVLWNRNYFLRFRF